MRVGSQLMRWPVNHDMGAVAALFRERQLESDVKDEERRTATCVGNCTSRRTPDSSSALSFSNQDTLVMKVAHVEQQQLRAMWTLVIFRLEASQTKLDPGRCQPPIAQNLKPVIFYLQNSTALPGINSKRRQHWLQQHEFDSIYSEMFSVAARFNMQVVSWAAVTSQQGEFMAPLCFWTNISAQEGSGFYYLTDKVDGINELDCWKTAVMGF